MVSSLRLGRLALTSALVLSTLPACAQDSALQDDAPAAAAHATLPDTQTALNAELFYGLLTAELSASQGDTTTAIALLLDAARELHSEPLYERATEVALQGRSGQQALRTAQEWQTSFPHSRAANRFVLQILLTLNRIAESQEPLAREVAWTPLASKPATYMAIAQLYTRASDKKLAAAVVEQALQADLSNDALAPAAWATIGHMRLQAQQKDLALQALAQAHAKAPRETATALLALELFELGAASAETMLQDYMQHQPTPAVQLAYAQVLLSKNRLDDAQAQLTQLLTETRDMPEAWLAQANLYAQQTQWKQAQQALQQVEPLLQSIPDEQQRNRALTPTYLLGARIALQQKDYPHAMTLLGKITHSSDLLMVQSLKAHALARQGKLAQGRALIRAVDGDNLDDNVRKRKAEVTLLRNNNAPQEAYLLQRTLHEQFPEDVDLAYETAILAESAGKTDVMEKMLRSIMEQHPTYAHAFNALGYSFADRGIHLIEAKQLIETALALQPDDPLVLDSLGWVEFRQGNTAKALRILEKAYAQRKDVEIAAHLGEVLWSSGNRVRALEIWRQAADIDADNPVLRKTLQRLQVQL